MGELLKRGDPGIRTCTLVFLHIPKTAGSTLKQVLAENYEAALTWQVESPVAESLSALRALPAERRAALRLIVGHGTYGIHDCLPQPSCYVSLLRDPVERLLSQYHFLRRSPQHPIGSLIRERRLDLSGYLESGINPHADNGQVRALAGGTEVPFGECSETMLTAALRNLERDVAVTGTTERFDESLLLMRFAFGWRHRTYTRQKVTAGRPHADALTARERELVDGCVALDKRLYARADALLSAAIRDGGLRLRLRVSGLRVRRGMRIAR